MNRATAEHGSNREVDRIAKYRWAWVRRTACTGPSRGGADGREEHNRRVARGIKLDSLDPEVDEGAEAAWQSEIAGRVRELDSGSKLPVPWAQVRLRLKFGLGDER